MNVELVGISVPFLKQFDIHIHKTEDDITCMSSIIICLKNMNKPLLI